MIEHNKILSKDILGKTQESEKPQKKENQHIPKPSNTDTD